MSRVLAAHEFITAEIRRGGIGLVVLIVICSASPILSAESFAFKLITLAGYPTPVGGAFDTFFDRPSINNLGDVVFLASVSGGRAASGVFLHALGEISTVVAEGQAVPLTSGATFNSFRQATINNRREVAFIATVQEGSSIRTGLFLMSGGVISTVGLSGQTVLDSGIPLTFRSFSLNDLGAIAFSSDSGILLFSHGTFSQIQSGPGGSDRPSLNNRGEVAFIGTSPGFRGSPSGVYIAVFSPTNRSSRTIFSGSGSLAADINDKGLVAFSGCQGGACGIRLYQSDAISTIETSTGVFGPPQMNNSGAVVYSNGQSFQDALTDQLSFFDGNALFRVRSDTAPVCLQGATFRHFGSPSLNDSGTMAFIASVSILAPLSPVMYRGVFLATPLAPNKLYFPHFGNGSDGAFFTFSQITLTNPDCSSPASASIEINDDNGDPLLVNLNGVAVDGKVNVTIPAAGKVTLRTDGLGPVRSGSVVVTSDVRIGGVILFGGSTGLAGVGDSRPMRRFIAPIETGPGTDCGVALMGVGQDQIVQLELRDDGGTLVASASLPVGAKAHVSRLVTELPWGAPLDLASFSGTLTVIGTAPMAAIVVLQSSGELARISHTKKEKGRN